MTTAAELLEEAWSWQGTPFDWQASAKGVGADCKGFIVGSIRACGLPEAEAVNAAVHDYGNRVPMMRVRRGLAATLEHVREMRLADILLMTFKGGHPHLGFYAGANVLHTYSGGPRQVLPTTTTVALRAWPLDSIWRLRSLEA